MKLKVFTFLHFKKDGEKDSFRKVKTVDTIPKILTILSTTRQQFNKKDRRPSQTKLPIGGIKEVPDDDDDSRGDDKDDFLDLGGSSDSSIEGDMDENDAYQAIIK